MWESYPAVYRTYFQLYNAYKWSVLDPRTVLEYCQLRTLTWDQLNNSAWGYFKPVCETIIREKQTWLWQSRLDWSIYSWGVYTWDVPIWVNWNWVWNMSWVTAQSDWLNFIQNFFNLAKSNLLTNYSWTPFVYYLVILLYFWLLWFYLDLFLIKNECYCRIELKVLLLLFKSFCILLYLFLDYVYSIFKNFVVLINIFIILNFRFN